LPIASPHTRSAHGGVVQRDGGPLGAAARRTQVSRRSRWR
jgi:hypothetical protein